MLIRVCSLVIAIEILVGSGNRVYQPRMGLSSKMVWRMKVIPSSVEAKKKNKKKSIVREHFHISKLFLLSGST